MVIAVGMDHQHRRHRALKARAAEDASHRLPKAGTKPQAVKLTAGSAWLALRRLERQWMVSDLEERIQLIDHRASHPPSTFSTAP